MKEKNKYVPLGLEVSSCTVRNRLCSASVVEPGINNTILLLTQPVEEINYSSKDEKGNYEFNQTWE